MARPRQPRHVALVVGTRPEAIKLAPVCLALRRTWRVVPIIVCTGQQADLAPRTLAEFGLLPTLSLAPDRLHSPTFARTSRLAGRLATALRRPAGKPLDLILVQGDTLSAVAGAMAGRWLEVPVGHVEAGLRSGDPSDPWPEENNRRTIATLAALHFAPTVQAWRNLVAEGVPTDRIALTGNTGIDAVRLARTWTPLLDPATAGLLNGPAPVLATAHRRNGFGRFQRALAEALNRLAAMGDTVVFVTHTNPRATDPVAARLAPAVQILPPAGFGAFQRLLAHAAAVITDSGGLQEEATVLSRPAVVIRARTERPEAIAAGARLAPPDPGAIVAQTHAARTDPPRPRARWLFGDGYAADRVALRIADFLNAPPTAVGPVATDRLAGAPSTGGAMARQVIE
ncbi:UDP-N-acetylglucosamine 2-epimerase (non-hydrolyzing) [Rhodothalassium salexigens]|nr:UDP-N-acetylglucosamine 2-epimerase (non-hydrolyzing) [Rhodothalassium salexigens]MBK5919815.1 UDP-N-acetylglucosamine 2-epimerase (non-hydrolyzing) [Rhodothalassium salexigens]